MMIHYRQSERRELAGDEQPGRLEARWRPARRMTERAEMQNQEEQQQGEEVGEEPSPTPFHFCCYCC